LRRVCTARLKAWRLVLGVLAIFPRL
jgi:hypothetical protein